MLASTLAILLVLIALSLPVAVVMGSLGLILDAIYAPFPLHLMIADIVWQHSNSFVLVAIPLFILMGEIVLRSGVAERMYSAMSLWLAWLPGGLMHANIGASAVFAATSGSSIATAATIATTALPEQSRRGYNERLFLGSIAAGGTLGILIPPSMNMIVYGSLTNTSVPQLFIAGILPGLLLAALYMTVILIACALRPRLDGDRPGASWRARLVSLKDLLAPLALLVIVMGSIYAGIATPTEAAALGVLGALAIALAQRRLSWRMLGEAIENTVRSSAMVLLMLLVAFFLNFVIASVGLVKFVNDFILDLGWSPLQTMLLIIAIYIVMGMFLETLAMVVLTVPILAPLVVALGYDPVWFGVLLVVLCEAAVLTPPVGMLCFVIQGVRGRGDLNDVFYGVAPFLLAIACLVAVILWFPGFILYLPELAFR